MATSVDRPALAHAPVHHARDPAWAPPPHHTRRARAARRARHGGRRRRYLWRDLALALLTVAAAAGVVLGVLEADPAARAAVLDLLGDAEAAVRDRVPGLLP